MKNDTHTSELYPDPVVIGEAPLQVWGKLTGVYELAQALQTRQVGLK